MKRESITYAKVLKEKAVPAIAINEEGIIFFINDRFEEEYGWSELDLTDRPVTTILPPYMRDAHNIGFSRFLTTGTHRILNKKMNLPVYCKDETVCDAIHFITDKKVNDKWKFAALIEPI